MTETDENLIELLARARLEPLPGMFPEAWEQAKQNVRGGGSE